MGTDMLKARDIMTKDVAYVKRNTPIFEAVELLIERKITGLPVVENDDMLLAGVLTEKDVLRLYYDGRRAEDKIVADFMTEPAVHYKETDSLTTICDFMMINYFRRVPVTSNGKLVGIISRPDILKFILDARQAETELQAETADKN